MRKFSFVFVGLCLAALILNFTEAQTPPAVVPVYGVDGHAIANAHIVVGVVSIPAGGGPLSSSAVEEFPVELADGAAFTSANSYRCFGSQVAGASPKAGGVFRIVDGAHFVFRTGRFGPSWTQDFICIGN